jgi:hypothetical protein
MATQTQEITQRLAPFQEDFLKSIFDQANALKSTPMPYAPQQVAGLSAEQQRAQQMIGPGGSGLGAYKPYLSQAAGYAGPGGAAQFYNPYENQAVQQAMQDINRAGQMQQQQLGAQAIGQGAFGGSRAAVAGAEIGRNVLEQQGRTAAGMRQAGYAQAQQAAQQAAQQYGQLGMQAQQAGVQDINTLLGIGGLTQQLSQQQLDVARANALAQQGLPFQQISFLSDLFRGVPSAQMTTTQQQAPPSMGSQLMGLGIAGLGAYGAFS